MILHGESFKTSQRGQKLHKDPNSKQNEAALAAKGKNIKNSRSFTGRCYVCNKQGHQAKNCRQKGWKRIHVIKEV